MRPDALRAVIYGRCSSKDQADRDLSVPAQLDACRVHAQRQGWRVVGEYRDDGISGFEDERRPDFRRMLTDMLSQPRPFDVIIVWDFSRFSRDLEHSLRTGHQLRAAGVQLESTKERIDNSPAGWLQSTILRSFNEYQVRKLADDTRRGMTRNATQGRYNGGTVPVGYRVTHTVSGKMDGAFLAPDPEWAPLVRRIFALALSGTGAAGITQQLNDEGLRTKAGRRWSKQSILCVLRNDVYTGTAKWGVKQCGKFANEAQPVIRVEDAHEALIGRDDFARVQAGIEMRRPTVMHPRTASGPYLLSGLLHCGRCGAAYVGHGSKKGAHHYYTCRTKQTQTAKACSAKNFSRDLAEATVIEGIRDHVLRPEHFAGLIRDVQLELRSQAAGAMDERAALATQLAEVNRKLERLYEAVEGGLIPHAQLAPRIAHQSSEREALSARLAALPTTERNPILAITPEEVSAWVANMRAVFDRASIDERRALLRAWIKRITADGDTLTIEYTFPVVGVDDGGPNGAAHVAHRAPVVLGTVVDENLGAQGWFAAPKMNEGVLPWWRVLPTVENGSRCWG